MSWDDFPKFFGTTKRRGIGRTMVDAVDGTEGFKTKVMMVNGEKLTLRTRGGFPRIYGEMTVMPVTPDPVSSGILQLFMVPSGEIGSAATGSNGYYKLSTGEYVLRPYSYDTTSMLFHESQSVDASSLFPVTERQFGNLDWFNKANSADASNPTVTWGLWSGGRHGRVPEILPSGWPTYSVYPGGNGIYVDGVLQAGSDKFQVLGAGMNSTGKVVAILYQGFVDPNSLLGFDGSTTLISVVRDDAGFLDLSTGALIPGWTEVSRKVITPQCAFFQPVLINSSGTQGATITRQKGGNPAVTTIDLATLTFTNEPNWKWRTYNEGLVSPAYAILSVPAGPTLNAGYDFPIQAARSVSELEQVIAVDYDGDSLIKLNRFSRIENFHDLVSPMTVKVVPPTFYTVPVSDALEENKAIIGAIVWDSGMVFSPSEIEAKAKAVLTAGKTSYDGGSPGGSYGGSTIRAYSHTSSGITHSDVAVSLIDDAFEIARAAGGRLETQHSTHFVGSQAYSWVNETTSGGLRVSDEAEVFLSSVITTGKGSEQSGYHDVYITGIHLQKFPTMIVGPGPEEGQSVDLNYVVVERSSWPDGSLTNHDSFDASLVTNTLLACDLRHRVFLIKQDNGTVKANFSGITLDTPPAVSSAEQLDVLGIDPGGVPDPSADLGVAIAQMTVHQNGTDLVYCDTINDQHTAYLCSVASPTPSPISAPVPGALFVAPIYFRKSPLGV